MPNYSLKTSLEEIRSRIEKFAVDRDWNQFHSPRNVLLAMMGEVGELAEIFQWKGEVEAGLPKFSPREKQHLGEELSDVLLYLIRLSDRCEVDLPSAVLRKLSINEQKYPAEMVRGSSKKYNEYKILNKYTRDTTGTSHPEKEQKNIEKEKVQRDSNDNIQSNEDGSIDAGSKKTEDFLIQNDIIQRRTRGNTMNMKKINSNLFIFTKAEIVIILFLVLTVLVHVLLLQISNSLFK